ncbi:MAG: hypothetical protein LUD50_07560 [Clostridia bacterium]|nr:hypothetical protein [Clostridia bacterium]
MKSMCSSADITLVYPVRESRVVEYGYCVLENMRTGDETLYSRVLRDTDFVCGTGAESIPESRLEKKIRCFSPEDVYDRLCAKEKAKIREDSSMLAIAAVIMVEKDRFVAVPVQYMSITGAGEGRVCVLRTPSNGIRFCITDSCGIVRSRANAVMLRAMLLGSYADDTKRFRLEIPRECVIDTGRKVLALLPEAKGAEGRYVMRVDKDPVIYRALKSTAYMDVPLDYNMEVRALRDNRVFSVHSTLLFHIARGKYLYSDALKEVSVSRTAVKAISEDAAVLSMPQKWHVTYKDSTLTLPATCITRKAYPADDYVHIMLCTGMYELQDEGKTYEVSMEDLMEALTMKDYGTEPRMYIKVPYKAVFRSNSRYACIGLVLDAGSVKKSKYSMNDFSCILKLDRHCFMDERCLGGKIWIAVPFGFRFEAWDMTEDCAVELGVTDVMRLIGALQKDLETAPAVPADSALAEKVA